MWYFVEEHRNGGGGPKGGGGIKRRGDGEAVSDIMRKVGDQIKVC